MQITADNILRAADLVEKIDELNELVRQLRRNANTESLFGPIYELQLMKGKDDITNNIDKASLQAFVIDSLEETLKANNVKLQQLGFEIQPEQTETETNVDQEQEDANLCKHDDGPVKRPHDERGWQPT